MIVPQEFFLNNKRQLLVQNHVFHKAQKRLIVDNFLKLLDSSLSSMYIRGCYLSWYTLNNIDSLEGTPQDYQHATTGEHLKGFHVVAR